MATEPDQEDLDALAALIRSERVNRQRLSIEQAAAQANGMSPVTWGKVERGLPVRPATYSTIEHLFGWPPGSVDAYLRDRSEPARPTNGEQDVPEWIKRILDDERLPEADRLEIVRIIQAEEERAEEELRRQREQRARLVVDTYRRARQA